MFGAWLFLWLTVVIADSFRNLPKKKEIPAFAGMTAGAVVIAGNDPQSPEALPAAVVK